MCKDSGPLDRFPGYPTLPDDLPEPPAPRYELATRYIIMEISYDTLEDEFGDVLPIYEDGMYAIEPVCEGADTMEFGTLAEALNYAKTLREDDARDEITWKDYQVMPVEVRI